MLPIQSTFLILGLSLLLACGEKGKPKQAGPVVAAKPEVVSNTDDSEIKSPDVSKEDETDELPDDEPAEGEDVPAEYSIYIGFDGKADYSLLLSGDWFSLKEAEAAKLENIEFSPSETVKTELMETIKAQPNYMAGDEEYFSDFFEADQKARRLTATKNGNFRLIDRDFPEDKITVVVNKYPESALALGKKRYETDGPGKLKACKSCHETGDLNAPPHELGEVMYCSDAQLKSWITTGSHDCYGREYTASVEHKWEFASDAEVDGVIAYLRNKQSRDYETLTKIMFKRHLQDYYYFSSEGLEE